MYTLQNIRTAPSYEALKRNGFTDIDCVAYYGTTKEDRPAFFKSFKQGVKIEPKSVQPKINKQGLFTQVDIELNRLMNHTFEFKGIKYNLIDLGYNFGWNNNKSRYGVHKLSWRSNFLGIKQYTTKRIELSKYALTYSEKQLNDWIDTILHEIAHAIDYEVRGTSNHDLHWVTIAKHIGCNGKRCGSFKMSKDAPSKYTIVCDNCGKKTKGHKHSKVISQGRRACGKCCKKHNGGVFDKRFTLRQIQNY